MVELRALGIAGLRAAYETGSLRPRDVVEALLARDAGVADPAIWIVPPERERLLARAEELERLGPDAREAMPLWGVPFAVKDNIDAADLTTTAACPAFAYPPGADAPHLPVLSLHPGCRLAGGAAPPRRRRHPGRQDKPRPVRDPPRRRALAL